MTSYASPEREPICRTHRSDRARVAQVIKIQVPTLLCSSTAGCIKKTGFSRSTGLSARCLPASASVAARARDARSRPIHR